MNAITAPMTANAFIPLALEEEDIATYAAIADALGCTPEECGEGFMLATPLARDAAVLLWRGAVALMPVSGAAGSLRLQDALGTLRALLGLDPRLMPHAALAEAGLRYAV
ncbi:polysaccharide deacetylase [Roseomonas aerophila]|uniref:Polysaccharide deacetylase n=1 Tax=Teichococcus aerophilus TaxID=1224513 RepID=A0ABR7RN61_9PROT|nr:polysaccharide deacetylase [Pseudoroseomonas aerophila]